MSPPTLPARPKIVGALLARNEAGPDRYLRRALANAAAYCDDIVVVDDRSTDDTARVCEEFGARVHRLEGDGQFWGVDESGPRALLWRLAASLAGPDGWVYVFDADHELLGLTPDELRTLCTARHVVAWAFPLYDCWDSDLTMRVDGFWQAHLHPRPWLARAVPIPDFTPSWDTRSIHSGHFPHNFPFHLGTGTVPRLAGIRHLGYVREEHRKSKHTKYLEAPLTDAERAHAASIIDPAELAPIPQVAKPKVLIASIIRKPPVVVDAFLKTLDWQRVNADCSYAFILNYGPEDAELPAVEQLMTDFAEGHHVKLGRVPAPPQRDYGDGGATRHWASPAFDRVAQLKDQLMEEAVRDGFDYLWLVDADVLCDPYTLQSLLDCGMPIVSGVYWTQWTRHQPNDAQIQHAGPQVWLSGSYGLSGWGWTESEFRQALIDRQLVKVSGLGANTLFTRDVLKKGIRFSRWTQLAPGPMSEGEDRQLCARAKAMHIPLHADAWPDIYHAYHPAEYDQIPSMLKRLSGEHGSPEVGWLTSIRLKNMEIMNAPPVWIRGRFGMLPVLPQIHEAIAKLSPGERTLVRAVFPASWPEDPLRGRTFVVEVSLLDAKPYSIAPVIDRELFVGGASGSYCDQTTLTEEQCNVIAGTPS